MGERYICNSDTVSISSVPTVNHEDTFVNPGRGGVEGRERCRGAGKFAVVFYSTSHF